MASRSFLVSFRQAFEATLGPRPGGTFGALLQAAVAQIITARTRTRILFLAAGIGPPFRGTSAAQKAQPALDTHGEGNSSTGRSPDSPSRQRISRPGPHPKVQSKVNSYLANHTFRRPPARPKSKTPHPAAAEWGVAGTGVRLPGYTWLVRRRNR